MEHDFPECIVPLLEGFFDICQAEYGHGYDDESVTYVSVEYDLNGEIVNERHCIDITDWHNAAEGIMRYCYFICEDVGIEIDAIKDLQLEYDV